MTEGVSGNTFPDKTSNAPEVRIDLASRGLVCTPSCHEVTEGKQQTCAKRNATEGVLGNPFPDKTSNAPEVRIDLASRCWVRAPSCHEVTEGKQ